MYKRDLPRYKQNVNIQAVLQKLSEEFQALLDQLDISSLHHS